MPFYEYKCGSCGKACEIFHSPQKTAKKCPHCGKTKLERQISAGGGFLFGKGGFSASTEHKGQNP